MIADHWLAMPEQIRKRLSMWQNEPAARRILETTFLTQYTGERVYAFTISNPDIPRAKKQALWISVPHAHEPAGTAASMNVLNQLLTGYDLTGQSCAHDVKAVLDACVVTFLPDANPGGRCWSPVLWWDGSKYTNDEFWQWMRGIDPQTGEMWQRVARWSLKETTPRRRGLVYEQLNDHEFVEPNRDRDSSFLRMFRQLDARYQYEYFLDLHQTEFENSDFNCTQLLPVDLDTRSATKQQQVREWAAQVRQAWRELGQLAKPEGSAREFPYITDIDTTKWFRDTWGEIDNRMPRLTVEVQNNSIRTQPEAQLALMETAIWASLERLFHEQALRVC